jgi:NTP pyrophosphatase (non-canonical NTP hydrolase)
LLYSGVYMNIKNTIKEVHENALDKGFYDKIYELLEKSVNDKDEYRVYKNLFICQQLLLVISELGEATEGLRQGNTVNFREEIADAVIRLFDLSGFLQMDLEYEIKKKMAVNKRRPNLHNKQF